MNTLGATITAAFVLAGSPGDVSRVVNLTGESIQIARENRYDLIVLPELEAARLTVETEPLGSTAHNVELSQTRRLEVEGLPGRQKGTIYVVTHEVLLAVRLARPDVYTIDVWHDVIYDDDGHIRAVRRLIR